MTDKEASQSRFFKENDIEDNELNRKLFKPIPSEVFNALLEEIGYDNIIAEEREKEAFKRLPSITSNRPEIYEFDNTKLVSTFTKYLTTEMLTNNYEDEIIEYDVVVNNHKGGKNYVVNLQVDMTGLSRSGKHKHTVGFDSFDMEVHNALCTLISAGNTAMTTDTIYRTMNGYSGTERVPKKTKEAIEDSLDKMAKVRVKADFTDHYKMKEVIGLDVEKVAKEGSMIDYVMEHTIFNGHETKVYKFSRWPIFYQYSRDIEQIQKVPIENLNLKGYMRMDQVKTVMRNYLVKRIEDMRYKYDRGTLYFFRKNGKLDARQSRIRYEQLQDIIKNIYENNNQNFTNATWNQRRRNLIDILKAFVDKGNIYYYEELKEQGKFNKVQIYFDSRYMSDELEADRRIMHPELYEE